MKIWKIQLAVLSVLALASSPLGAQEVEKPGPSVETIREYQQLAREVQELFREKKYEGVLQKCRRMTELIPDEPIPYYNLACAQALLGKTEEAFKSLGTSVERGFDEPTHMKKDEDLAGLRADKRFAELVEKARENEKKGAGRYEPGIEIPDVKTVEDFPEGGLRFRLRMSGDATKDKPNRLIVWLHPAGHSMNRIVETLAPRFLNKNFALLVFTQKNFRYWRAADAKRLMERTLPALAKIEGIDAKKPILFGYSAGGQQALYLWKSHPDKFGGLILDAAYPVRRTGPRSFAPIKLPEHEAAKRVPLFALVGEKDGGARFWRQLEPVWQRAGIPLTVHYVPDKGHTWLFGKFQLAALDAWLSDVAAGKIPRPPIAEPEDNDPNAKPEPPEFR